MAAMSLMTFVSGVLMCFGGCTGHGGLDGGGFPVHTFHEGVDIVAGQLRPRDTGGGKTNETDKYPGSDGGV